MEDYDMGIPVDRAALETTLADAVNLAPSIMVESALFGVLTCLATYSIIIIAVMRRGMTKRSRVFMGSAMGIIYITSGIHWSFNIYTFIREIRNPIAWAALPPEAIYNWSLITTSALFCGFWTSDIIVMWRAAVIWHWHHSVTVPCAILIVVSVAFAMADVVTSHATVSDNIFRPNTYGFIALAISLFSNIWATLLIGIKAWSHRKIIKEFLNNSKTSSAVQNMLILLVESGLLYCALWALFIVIALLNNDASTHIAHTLSGVVPQLVGLYPSLIIILATLQKTHCDRSFIYGPDASSPVLHTHRSMEIIPSMVQLEE